VGSIEVRPLIRYPAKQPDSLVTRYLVTAEAPGLRCPLFHMRDKAEQPSRLHVLTFENTAPQPDAVHDCAGYTCSHPLCAGEREHRVQHLTRRPRRTAQPWEPRKAA